MILQIENILTLEECHALRESFDTTNAWIDGSETATGYAKSKKSNLQGNRQNKLVAAGVKKITTAMRANRMVMIATRPQKFARILFNLYKEGMSYGHHTDAPFIEEVRTDISFTLFLNDPSEYEGGELIIDTVSHRDNIKGNIGSIVVYPASTLHHVSTVTKGERFACVGWIQSRVKSQEDRTMLLEVEQIIQDAKALTQDGEDNLPLNLKLNNLRNNLLRRFAD